MKRAILDGTSIVSPRALQSVPNCGHYMFERGLFPELIRRGEKICGFPSSSYWIDVGSPERYLKIHNDLLLNEELKKEKLVREAIGWSRDSSYIHPEARLIGPVVLGRGCTVEESVRIKGTTSIGEHCYIGADAIIEGSIMWDGVRIGKGARIKKSVIASGCIVEEEAILNETCILGRGAKVLRGQELPVGTRI